MASLDEAWSKMPFGGEDLAERRAGFVASTRDKYLPFFEARLAQAAAKAPAGSQAPFFLGAQLSMAGEEAARAHGRGNGRAGSAAAVRSPATLPDVMPPTHPREGRGGRRGGGVGSAAAARGGRQRRHGSRLAAAARPRLLPPPPPSGADLFVFALLSMVASGGMDHIAPGALVVGFPRVAALHAAVKEHPLVLAHGR